MGMFDWLLNQVGDNVLTLSGEILISPASPSNKGAIAQTDRIAISKSLAKIKRRFPYIRIENTNGLVEVVIKFFAHEARTNNDNFLDEFQNTTVDLVKEIFKEDIFAVRVNMFGKFETLHSIKEYRYLNKRDEVRYTIVDEVFKGSSAALNRPIYYLIVGIILCGSYLGYVGYQKFFGVKPGIKVEQKVEKSQKAGDVVSEDKKLQKQIKQEKPAGVKEL